ncbi:MAG: FtsX-like permease family protein [Spirochaetia bacterium]
MKFLVNLAFKNLFRHKRRTMITSIAIAVGLALFILIDSMLVGIEEDSTRNLMLYETGSARIMNTQFWEEHENLPLKHSIDKPQPILEELDAAGIDAAPRTIFRGELIMQKDPYPESGSIQAQITAIDPQRDPQVYLIDESISDGRFLEEDRLEAVVGAWLAEDIGAQVGYPLTIVTRTKEGFFQTIDLEIVGLANTPNPVVNRTGIFIPIKTADYYLQMEGSVSQIDTSFAYQADIEEQTSKIRSVALSNRPDLTVVDWKILGKDFVALAASKSAGSKVILFLVFIIAAVGISNTMLMSVYERIREIGMLRALGMRRHEIRLAFLIEAGGIGLIGASAGVLIGVLLNIPLVNIGVDYSALMRDADMGYRVTGIMRGLWSTATIFTAFFTGVFLSVLMAFIPTRKALKLQITDALRYQ